MPSVNIMLIGAGNKTTTVLRGIGIKGGGLCINHCHWCRRIKGNVGGCYCIVALRTLIVALLGTATAVIPSIVPHTSNWTANIGRGDMYCVPEVTLVTQIVGTALMADGLTLIGTRRSAAPRGQSTIVPTTSVAGTSTLTMCIIVLVHSSISPIALIALIVSTTIVVAIGSLVATLLDLLGSGQPLVR